MTVDAALFSSEQSDWNTPEEPLVCVRAVEPIGLDPCSNATSIVCAAVEWTFERDGDSLQRDWTEGDGIVFVNPPYGRSIGEWVAKCQRTAMTGRNVVALLPARVDTKWFRYAWEADALCFWHGRLTFLGANANAPFPSVFAYWGKRPYRFADAFADAGRIVLP